MEINSLVECIENATRNWWVDDFGERHYGDTGNKGNLYIVEGLTPPDAAGHIGLILVELKTPIITQMGILGKAAVNSKRFVEVQSPMEIKIELFEKCIY